MRDEDTGEVWSADARCRSARTSGHMSSRHGQGYSRFEHDVARHRARAPAVRAGRRSDQDLAADDRQSLGARAPAVGHRVSRMGARRVAQQRRRRSSSPRSMPRPARCSRGTPGAADFGDARRVCRPRRRADGVDRRPRRNSWAATARSTARPRSTAPEPLSGRVGRGPRSVRRAADRLRLAPGASVGGRLSARRRPDTATRRGR